MFLLVYMELIHIQKLNLYNSITFIYDSLFLNFFFLCYKFNQYLFIICNVGTVFHNFLHSTNDFCFTIICVSYSRYIYVIQNRIE